MPTYVSSTGVSGHVSASSVSTPSVAVSGTDLYMIVSVIEFGTGSNPTSVAWDPTGVNSVLVIRASGNYFGSGGRQSMWSGIVTAATGVLKVTFPTAVSEYAVAVSWFSGVDPTTPIGVIVSSILDTTPTSITLTPASAVGDLVAAFGGFNGSSTVSAGTGFTSIDRNERDSGFSGAYSGHATASSPTTSVTVNESPGNQLGMCAFAMKPSGGGGGGLPFFMQSDLMNGGTQTLAGGMQ